MEDRYGTRRCKVCEGLMDLPDGEYCSYCKPKDRPVETKKIIKRKKPKHMDTSMYVEIPCTKCQRVIKIRTNQKEIYTAEVRNTFICMQCTNPPKHKSSWQL